MKAHTSEFKETIKTFGRELDSKITYTIDGVDYELGGEELNSVTPHFESQILKSAMRGLDIDSNVEIPIGTVINFTFGIKVNDAYEYLDYGDYIVKESEKQEDLRSYKITCYDFMLKSMIDYESMEITYPITVRNYINAICTHLGLTFKNASGTFANYDKEIPNELYLDETGASLGYTFRDVLDELAQVTASIICIDQETDELEIRYVEDVQYEIETASGTTINLDDATGKKINELKANKVSTQDAAPTPDAPQEVKTIKNSLNVTVSDGTTSRNYTISLGNNEIVGIGNYLDELVVDSTGHVYLNKKIGKVILDGTESWAQRNSGDGSTTISFNHNISNIGAINSMSDLFPVSTGSTDGREGLAVPSQLIQIYIQIKRSRLSSLTVSAFKSWLSNNNVTAYYVYRDSQLIDLNTTIDITLFNGINNITTSENANLSIKYYTQEINTDTIDEEYLKDVNVNFGEKFGAINTIVLSRAGGSDNIYYPSILPENPIEIKIEENQIMNFNNRDEFMPAIYEKLNGLEYYTNDYVSTGICYYDIGDRYIVSVDDNKYSCVMFNDEINITQGLLENIYTEMPENTNTDYTKADKTDRKINQTWLMVDKQNGVIESLAERVVDVSNTIKNTGQVQLENAHEGILHKLSFHGNISLIYPNSNLYPSSILYPYGTYLLIDETKYKLDFDILRYMSSTLYDEFVYEDGTCKIIRRIGIDENNQMYALENEVIEQRENIYLEINSNSIIKLESFDNVYYEVTYLLENEYTDNFATNVNVSSQITQTNNKIEATVKQVADENGEVTAGSILLAVNKDESQAKIQADKIALEGYTTINGNFKIDENGDMEVNDGTFNGLINAGKIEVKGYSESDPYVMVGDMENDSGQHPYGSMVWDNGISVIDYRGTAPIIRTEFDGGYAQMRYGDIECTGHISSINGICQGSLEELKKDFEKLESGLDIIKNIDIYKYKYKKQKDEKKHIGLVIGKNYKYSKEVTNNDNTAIDIYSFVSVCCKAIQEQQIEIENLKKEMEELKNAKN